MKNYITQVITLVSIFYLTGFIINRFYEVNTYTLAIGFVVGFLSCNRLESFGEKCRKINENGVIK